MKNAAQSRKGSDEAGVGGRQDGSTTPIGGGGSLNFCKKFSRGGLAQHDPRFAELREVGLAREWVALAEMIGVDAFLEVWKLLDRQAEQVNQQYRRVYVPAFSNYLRFQRNRYIIALFHQGAGVPEIKKIIREALCEEIGERHITRIIAKSKMPE